MRGKKRFNCESDSVVRNDRSFCTVEKFVVKKEDRGSMGKREE